jgi:cytochrome c-type biogenesis protein CcmF
LDADWIIAVRRWTLFAWTFLGSGILLGAIWAYETLSFGGYWAWDPVENASFMPWLTGTAFLHSVMIQEKKGMLKGWNMVLVTITFALSIFGTFLTRSGIIQSVHSFAQSGIGPYFSTFLLMMLILAFGFLFLRGWYVSSAVVTLLTFGIFILHTFKRLKMGIHPPDPHAQTAYLPPDNVEYLFLMVAFAVTAAIVNVVASELWGMIKNDGKPRYNALQGENEFEAWLSREGAFLVNNWLFVGAALAVLWGTMYPVITEAILGQKITVGQNYFNIIMPPIGLLLLFLTGVGPLVAWRRSSPKNLQRNFRVPTLVALVSMPILWLLGARENIYLLKILPVPLALISFALSVFVTAAIGWEFYRGAKARHDLTGESYLAGLINLTLRNRRRYGGYIVHLAVALFFVGVTGSMMFKREVQQQLQRGDTLRIGGYELKFEKVERKRVPDWKTSLVAHVTVSRNGRKVATLKPRQDTFDHHEEMSNTPIPAIIYTPQHDLYLVLQQVATPNNLESSPIHLKVYFFPLLVWIWVSGVIYLFGSVICMLPAAKELRAAERAGTRGWVMEG